MTEAHLPPMIPHVGVDVADINVIDPGQNDAR